MKHIDLFSGIGGFAYAAKTVWGDEYENVLFCDNNKFCQEVIKKNFGKSSVIYDDIRNVTYAESSESRQQTEQKGRENIGGRNCDLLTGGFPCQPFSQAGKRKGKADDRYLWPEMLRVIQEFKPAWIIAENVRGLLTIEGGLVFEQVCIDLEREGYEVQPFIIPAVSVNAPHRRDRIWIVAHAGHGNGTREKNRRKLKGQIPCAENAAEFERPNRHENEINAFDSTPERLQQGGESERQIEAGDACGRGFTHNTQWDKHWLEVATRTCSRGVDDGLPVELDGFKLTKAGHRVERLKALGNAIVPQVAIKIMTAIKESD